MIALHHGTVETVQLETELREVLAGRDPDIVGAALGMIVATYLVGIPPSVRRDTRYMLIELIDDLVPIVLGEMIESGRVPADWKETTQ